MTDINSVRFIFANESVDSVYNLMRIVINELDTVLGEINSEIRKYGYYDYEEYSDECYRIFKIYINNSIFINIPYFYSFEGYQYLFSIFKEYITKGSLWAEYENILKYESYEKYLKYIQDNKVCIYDIHLLEDEEELINSLDLFGEEYLERNNISDLNIYEISDKKQFLLDNMGSVVVTYKEEYFNKLFYVILDYFANYSFQYYYGDV